MDTIVETLNHLYAEEADCWRDLEAWRVREPHTREYSVGVDIHAAMRGWPFEAVLNMERGKQIVFTGRTRMEALRAAGSFASRG